MLVLLWMQDADTSTLFEALERAFSRRARTIDRVHKNADNILKTLPLEHTYNVPSVALPGQFSTGLFELLTFYEGMRQQTPQWHSSRL